MTVTKYDSKPAQVSKEKEGNVYQYLQINTENLINKLNKATVQFKVEKSWAEKKGLSKEKVSVSKFNESAKEWMELETKYSNEDSQYYYYNVELTSFSYFAISDKSVAKDPAATDSNSKTGAENDVKSAKNLTWLWIVIIILAVGIILSLLLRHHSKKKKRMKIHKSFESLRK